MHLFSFYKELVFPAYKHYIELICHRSSTLNITLNMEISNGFHMLELSVA